MSLRITAFCFYTIPGGFHFGSLPPDGLRDTAALEEEMVEEGAAFLDAGLAGGGLLTGVEAAKRK